MNIRTRRYFDDGIAPSAGELCVKLSNLGCGESQCCRFLMYCQSSWITWLFCRIKSIRHSIRCVFIIVYHVIASVFIFQYRGNTNPGRLSFVLK